MNRIFKSVSRLKPVLLILSLVLISMLMTGCNSKNYGAANAASSPVKDSTTEAKGIKVTFVELGSVNCIPCRMMQPVMQQVEKKYPGQVKVVFHDVWTEAGRTEGAKYKIRVIPTQVFLDKNGKEYFRHEGFFSFEEIDIILKQQGVR